MKLRLTSGCNRPLLRRVASSFNVRVNDLTDRSSIPTSAQAARGTVFSKPNARAYKSKSPDQLFRLAVAESALPDQHPSSATIFIEALPQPLMDTFLEYGLLLIDALRISNAQIKENLQFAKAVNVNLDYHAPWLVRQADGKYFYPTPKINVEIFNALVSLTREHARVFGAKPQLTFHLTGEPKEWITWLNEVRQHAEVLVENSFVMRLAAAEQRSKVFSSFDYFNWSDFHAPREFMAWMRAAGLNQVCFDQAHAFGGWRFENKGRFDPLGDLKFLEKLMDHKFNIARMHRASVPRDLAGSQRTNQLLSQLDTHTKMQPFSRTWFLDRYEAESVMINRIFDTIAGCYPLGMPVTFEINPQAVPSCNLQDFATDFS